MFFEERYDTSIVDSNLDMEKVMKFTIAEIGSVTGLTRDYSGNYGWDQFVYDFKKFIPWA